jgi:hypothetical protein
VDSFASPAEQSQAPETSNAPDMAQPSPKPKRSKAKLATLGVAAMITAGAFAAINVNSAQAAETRTGAVEVDVIRIGGVEDKQSMISDASTQLTPQLCGTPAGEPNPQRTVVGEPTIQTMPSTNGKERARVTLTLQCKDGDNPPPQKPGFGG